jgi:hypothetical protein
MMVASTYDNFYALVLHVIGKAYKHPDRWRQVGQIRFDYWAKKASLIRKFAMNREVLLYRNYVFLQDLRASNFQDTGLTMKLTESMMDLMLEKTDRVPDEGKTRHKCTHCHGEFHVGGSAQCPLKEMKTKTARTAAADIDAKIKSGETQTDAMIEEVRSKYK